MKLFLLVVSIFIISFSAYATNGDNLIGVTPASRGMGGLGIGTRVGTTDGIFRNPAWMNDETGFNLTFGGLLMLPKVKARMHNGTNDSGYIKSDADHFSIPEVAIVHRLNKKMVLGIGAFGVSGMGVDYRNKNSLLASMHTNLQFMKVVPALSVKMDSEWSYGLAFDIAWGSLDLGALMQDSNSNIYNAGGGQQQDFGFGYHLGITYKKNEWSFGLVYQSSIKMKYKNVFDSDNDKTFENLRLEQPKELGIGIGKQINEKLKVGFDYKKIYWEKATGYKEFKWKNQNIYILGIEYKANNTWTWRMGYNYAKSPIRDQNNLNLTNSNIIPDFTKNFSDFDIYWFNLMGFPAISEKHFSLGFNYKVNENFSLDFSYVRAFKNEVVAKGNNGGFPLVGAENEQNIFGLSLSWHF